MRVPDALRPVVKFGAHVIGGSLAFLTVYTVSVGVGVWVESVGTHGSSATVRLGRWAETAILWLDLFGLALFLLKETLKLCRDMLLRDWD